MTTVVGVFTDDVVAGVWTRREKEKTRIVIEWLKPVFFSLFWSKGEDMMMMMMMPHSCCCVRFIIKVDFPRAI